MTWREEREREGVNKCVFHYLNYEHKTFFSLKALKHSGYVEMSVCVSVCSPNIRIGSENSIFQRLW